MNVPDTSSDDAFVLEMELDLDEDVPAELEDFILHSRLGLFDEAIQLADDILWRHLHHFPVFAEIAAFLLEHGDDGRTYDLLEQLISRNISFQHPDENDFLNHFLEITTSVTPTELLSSAAGLLSDVLADIKSPIHLHACELGLTCLINRFGTQRGGLLLSMMYQHCCSLLAKSLIWEATQIFSMLCCVDLGSTSTLEAEDGPTVAHIRLIYEDLMIATQERSILRHVAEGHALCQAEVAFAMTALLAKTSFLQHLYWHLTFQRFELDWLLIEAVTLLKALFAKQENSELRGHYVASLARAAFFQGQLPAAYVPSESADNLGAHASIVAPAFPLQLSFGDQIELLSELVEMASLNVDNLLRQRPSVYGSVIAPKRRRAGDLGGTSDRLTRIIQDIYLQSKSRKDFEKTIGSTSLTIISRITEKPIPPFRSNTHLALPEFNLPRSTNDEEIESVLMQLVHQRGWENLPDTARTQLLASATAKKWALTYQDNLTEWRGEQERRLQETQHPRESVPSRIDFASDFPSATARDKQQQIITSDDLPPATPVSMFFGNRASRGDVAFATEAMADMTFQKSGGAAIRQLTITRKRKLPGEVQDTIDTIPPTYIRMQIRHLPPEILSPNSLPWQYDEQDDRYLLIKKYVSLELQQALVEETARLQQYRD